MARIHQWFTIDSNFKRPILKTVVPLRGSGNELSKQTNFCKACSLMASQPRYSRGGLNTLVTQPQEMTAMSTPDRRDKGTECRYVSKDICGTIYRDDYVLYRHGSLVFPAQCSAAPT